MVAKQDGQVVGWAALSPVSSRCVYGGVAEVSVYISPQAWGQGIGKTLLKALVDASEDADPFVVDLDIASRDTQRELG